MNSETALNDERAADAAEAAEKSAIAGRARHPMEILLKSGAAPLQKKAGDIVEGTVIEKRGGRLFADLGPTGTGIVYGREYYAADDIIKELKPGDTVSAKVIEPDNEEGYVELSLKEAGEEKRWLDLKKFMEEKQVLELPVKEANRGGLIVEFKGISGFLPASQLASQHYPRVEGGDKEKIYQELQKLAGEVLKVRIIDLDPRDQKLIFSEKESAADSVSEKLKNYKTGDVVEGNITGVLDFGAFLRFDEGLEGLIHISEIDWALVEDPRQTLKAGDKMRAKIIDIQGGKVSLSLKQLKDDPWQKLGEKYRKGDTVKGVVTKFNPFGAFVEIENGIQGLLHISEFGRVEKMKEALSLDAAYDFKILLLDPKEHRMGLTLERPAASNAATEPLEPPAATLV